MNNIYTMSDYSFVNSKARSNNILNRKSNNNMFYDPRSHKVVRIHNYSRHNNLSKFGTNNKEIGKDNMFSLKIVILIMAVIIISFALSFTFLSNNVKAEDVDQALFKYYKVITVESGDNLWTMANDYGYENMKTDFIKEVIELNSLSNDRIVEGQWIVVPYYSAEFKK